MSWSRFRGSKTGKYAILIIAAIAIIAIAAIIIITVVLPPGEITITGTVTILRSHDPLNDNPLNQPIPSYIKFINVNSSTVFEYIFTSSHIVYLGTQEEYSQKVPNGQTYRVEIGWSSANSSGMWIAGTYSFDQPAGQPTVVKDFVG